MRLGELGYYRFINEPDAIYLRGKFGKTGDTENDVFAEASMRVTLIDGEAIYEQGLEPFIAEVGAISKLAGLTLAPLVEPPDNGIDYRPVLCGVEFLLQNFKEPACISDPWGLCTDRAIRAANFLLERAGIADRFYWDRPGNDTLCVLMTQEMYNVLIEEGAIEPARPFQI
jgi:hypothetical protein